MEAYPLHWPEGYTRTQRPQRSRFGKLTLHKTRSEVTEQVRLLLNRRTLTDRDIIISTNMPIRKDGGVYSNAKEPDNSGVAVYFMYKDQQRVFACDKWSTVKENLHAIAKNIDAIRGMSRWGVSEMLDRIFTGFIGIPEKTGPGIWSWWEVLGVNQDATTEEIKKAYREKMKEVHPDKNNGESEKAIHVNNAYRAAMENIKHKGGHNA